MKKGDILKREVILPQGTRLVGGFPSPEAAKVFYTQDMEKHFGRAFLCEIKEDPMNPKCSALFLIENSLFTERATCMWAVDNEASIQIQGTEGFRIINVSSKEWQVEVESVPSYQSTVATLSDEELLKSINEMRTERFSVPTQKVKKASAPKISKQDQAVLDTLMKLPEAERTELAKKLGIIL